MRHTILRARRVVFRNNRLVSVGGLSHFPFLFPLTSFSFRTFSVFLSDHRSSSHFLPLVFQRESILREAVFLFRPLIPCLFIFFSPIVSLSPDAEMSNTWLSAFSLSHPFQLPNSSILLFSPPTSTVWCLMVSLMKPFKHKLQIQTTNIKFWLN